MGRLTNFQVTTDTSFFTPVQMQPRVLLGQSFNGFSRWLDEHLMSFPELIRQERTSVVIMGVRVRYRDEVDFFHTPSLDVSSSVEVLYGGKRLLLRSELSLAERRVADVDILLCPVLIEDQASLAAHPGALPASVLARFEADEISARKPTRDLPARFDAIKAEGTRLVASRDPFFVHRHLCEIADQWLFAQVPGLCEQSRNRLVFEHMADSPPLALGLEGRLGAIDIELYRPYYSYDEGWVDTEAYTLDGSLYFLHKLGSKYPGRSCHGRIIESFHRSGTC